MTAVLVVTERGDLLEAVLDATGDSVTTTPSPTAAMWNQADLVLVDVLLAGLFTYAPDEAKSCAVMLDEDGPLSSGAWQQLADTRVPLLVSLPAGAAYLADRVAPPPVFVSGNDGVRVPADADGVCRHETVALTYTTTVVAVGNTDGIRRVTIDDDLGQVVEAYCDNCGKLDAAHPVVRAMTSFEDWPAWRIV